MADEFDLSALKNAMGVSNKPTTSNVSTVISPEIQRKRDEDALSIQQAELKKAQLALTQTTDPKQKLRLEADIAGLTREISRNSASKGAPATAPIAPSVPAQQQDFDLSGVKSAMGLQAPTTATPPDQQQITGQTTSSEAPVQPAMPQRMFEPKTELEKQVMQGIESLPGSKELGAFGQAVTGTVSKSVSAIQQLVGKYFPGLSDDQRQTIVDNATQSAKQTEAALKPVEEQYPKSALAGEVTGFVVNPINKLVPTLGAAPTTLLGAGLKAGGQGAVANVLTTPITEQEKPFETQKIMQAVTGAIGGAGAGVAFLALGHQLGKGVDAIRRKFNNVVPDNEINQAASQIVLQAGIDSSKVSPQFFNSLVDQAKSALRTGDVKGFQQFAKNYAEANSLAVPVPMLRGQLTRDPMQYAVEQNLRGIQGVGEPIQAVLQKQNSALLQNLDEYGAKLAQPVVNSGSFLRNVLKQIDAGEAQKVRDAYAAFKNSTGKDLDIPLSGLAQDYAKVVKDFGRSTIPEGVRNNLESLGLMKGKQLKVTTIEDAEAIIKNINANYDKTKPVQMKALDELRRAVEDSIKGAGANLPGEAGALAKAARDAASKRFDTIADIPALKDTMKGIEPDKFIQKHILQGNVNEIDKLVKYLQNHSPETLTQLRADVMGVIKNRVTNNVSDANAKFSADGLKGFVAKDSASLSRLEKFLSPDQINGLQKLNRVAENVLVEPVASAVNRSNTASAAANLIQGTVKSGAINELLSNIASIKFPGVATGAKYLAEMNQGSRAQELINQAITPTAKAPSVPIRTMVKPGVAGAGALTGGVQQSNIQYEKENR
jgi:bifunctional DNA-binding transcriptional regulator/antitoxin component of YhaV-PrlF toxin-antitoxin module